MYENEHKVAAQWWADRLAGPCKQDNGDRSMTGMLTAGLMAMNQSSLQYPSEEQLEKFKAALVAALDAKAENHAQRGGDYPYRACLGVDYGPDADLAKAAEAAGIDGSRHRFPIKTVMWINPGDVAVRYGYGADETPLYLTQEAIDGRIAKEKKTLSEYRDGDALSYIEDEERRKERLAETIKWSEEQIAKYEAMEPVLET
jgi:hypothetical protein